MTVARTEKRLTAFAGAGLDQVRMRTWAIIRGAYLGAGEDQARVLLSLLLVALEGSRRHGNPEPP